ncbi:hypothetical protein GCM10009624_26560 [Gordonia sinesedis]
MALPDGQNLVVLIATSGSSRDRWSEVVETIQHHSGETRFEFVDGVEYEDLTAAEIRELLDNAGGRTYAFLVDDRALTDKEHPVLAVSCFSEDEVRVVPAQLAGVADNLAIANLSIGDFARAADSDGVLRT